MIKSILKQWIFINYCGQKIGQFKGANLKETLLNVTTSNISFIIYGIILLIYGLLGFRSVFYFLLIAVPVEFLITRPLIKKHIMTIASMQELEARYRKTPRWKRIMFFILSLLIIILSVVLFISILSSARFFK
ncbi:hypothetical protein SAMN05216273_114100 [Chryseobacterium taihuense]|uniref:Uncharacterized protein n=1 Tax=Chryseobacterium taihuense TaxID=1141221 RepID=A0ABY0QZ78_9FLAO|nr:hypothetical protein SAMN05216273_114100 [Chryseobacterium taihuense]